MKKIFALFVSAFVIAACTDPFDATSIWDKLNELENKINDTNTPEVECENNEIHYVTSDGKPLIPKKLGIATFGANLVSNNIENGIGTLVFDKDITEIGDNAFTNYSTLVSIIIPNSVTSIGVAAFNGCSGLTSITIPNSVTSIGSSAFNGCKNLKEVHINDIAAWCSIDFGGWDSNPLCYAHNLYSNNELVTELVIPNGVISIGGSAFYNCDGLTSITIPNSVTSIGYGAFYDCSGLTSVTIGNSVTSIGEDAFFQCSGLTSITIGEGVTSIEDGAFSGCSGLTSITIPNSVTSIGDYAFDRCSGLKEVHITDLDAWKNISFGNYYANPLNNSNAKLYLNGVEVK